MARRPAGTAGLQLAMRPRSFTAKAAGITWTDRGKLWDNDHWGAASVKFVVSFRATSGTAKARLYNVTGATPVTASVVSTSSSTENLIKSSAFTLTDGNRYRAQTGLAGGDAGEWLGCSIEEQ